MIVKIVGFKVGVDRSTCYYKLTDEDCPYTYEEWERKLGYYLRLALDKSDFVSIRQ